MLLYSKECNSPYAGVANVGGLEGCKPSNDTFPVRRRLRLRRTGKGILGRLRLPKPLLYVR